MGNGAGNQRWAACPCSGKQFWFEMSHFTGNPSPAGTGQPGISPAEPFSREHQGFLATGAALQLCRWASLSPGSQFTTKDLHELVDHRPSEPAWAPSTISCPQAQVQSLPPSLWSSPFQTLQHLWIVRHRQISHIIHSLINNPWSKSLPRISAMGTASTVQSMASL